MPDETIKLRDVVDLIALDVRKFNGFIDDMNRSRQVDMEEKVFIYARKHMHMNGEIRLAYRMGIDIALDYEERPCCLERIKNLRFRFSGDEEWEVIDLDEKQKSRERKSASQTKQRSDQ